MIIRIGIDIAAGKIRVLINGFFPSLKGRGRPVDSPIAISGRGVNQGSGLGREIVFPGISADRRSGILDDEKTFRGSDISLLINPQLVGFDGSRGLVDDDIALHMDYGA